LCQRRKWTTSSSIQHKSHQNLKQSKTTQHRKEYNTAIPPTDFKSREIAESSKTHSTHRKIQNEQRNRRLRHSSIRRSQLQTASGGKRPTHLDRVGPCSRDKPPQRFHQHQRQFDSARTQADQIRQQQQQQQQRPKNACQADDYQNRERRAADDREAPGSTKNAIEEENEKREESTLRSQKKQKRWETRLKTGEARGIYAVHRRNSGADDGAAETVQSADAWRFRLGPLLTHCAAPSPVLSVQSITAIRTSLSASLTDLPEYTRDAADVPDSSPPLPRLAVLIQNYTSSITSLPSAFRAAGQSLCTSQNQPNALLIVSRGFGERFSDSGSKP
jgi:hypothetical protein